MMYGVSTSKDFAGHNMSTCKAALVNITSKLLRPDRTLQLSIRNPGTYIGFSQLPAQFP